jgi:colanic acid/amylovoran biosynthesis protein
LAPKIVITNVVALNSGDGAILLGIIKILRHRFGVFELTVLDSQAPIAQRLYPELHFEPLTLKQTRRRAIGFAQRTLVQYLGAWRTYLPGYARNAATYRKADLIISTGGTYLVEHYDLRDRIYQFDLAVKAGKPIVMFTQSLGPFKTAPITAWLRRLMPNITLALLRDERSAGNLRDIGALPRQMEVAADAAFALADPDRLKHAGCRVSGEKLRVAVSVRSWSHFRPGSGHDTLNTYYAGVAQAVETLIRQRGARITFISTCQGVAEYWTDDSKAAAEIIAMIDPSLREHITLERGFHRAEALIDILSKYDLTIATRMHMAILSLCAGTPVFPIAYEFKTTELFTNLGLGDWVVDIEDVEGTTLPAKLLAFIDSLPGITPGLMNGVLQQYESAISSGALLPEITMIEKNRRKAKFNQN